LRKNSPTGAQLHHFYRLDPPPRRSGGLERVHSSAQRQLDVPVEITGLTDAVHTLRIVVRGPRGRKFVAVDGWEVH
jgi:hypothetical protein